MTLLEVANYVCQKIDQTDTDSVQAARDFASKRMRLIWDAYLWPDTLVVYPDTAPVSTRYVAPEPFERILEIRRADNTICKFFSPQAAFQTDPMMLDSTSDPVGWMHDTSVGVPYWSDIEGIFPSVAINANPGSRPIGGGFVATNSVMAFKVRYLRNKNQEAEAIYTGGIVSASIVPVNCVRSIALYNTDGTTPSFTGASFTIGGISVPFTEDRLTSQAYPVVRWLGQINTSETILVMAKRRFRDLLTEGDSDLLPGTDNALIAFVQADMLQRDRQYAKANMLAEEGNAMLNVCTSLLSNQQAAQQRIIPEDIGGNDWNNGFGYMGFSSKTTW